MNWTRLLPLVLLLAACETEPKAEKAGPYLWKATGELGTVYLMGTIHVPDPRVIDLPVVVKKAFEESDVVLTELLIDGKTQVQAMQLMLLPKGQRLRDLIPKEKYERMAKVVPLAGLDQYQIWAASIQLMLFHARHQFLSGRKAMDLQFPIDAKIAGKEVGALETAAEQIKAFDKLTTEEQVMMLEQTVDLIAEDRRKGTNFVDQLVDIYLSGDLEKVMTHSTTFGKMPEALEKKVNKALLDDRNKLMAKRLLEKMKAKKEKKTWFVAVGAAHHYGPTGLPTLLRAEGFKVARVPGTFPAPAGK